MVSQPALGPPCFTQQSHTRFTFSFTCQLCFWWPCSPTRGIFCTRDRRSYTNTWLHWQLFQIYSQPHLPSAQSHTPPFTPRSHFFLVPVLPRVYSHRYIQATLGSPLQRAISRHIQKRQILCHWLQDLQQCGIDRQIEGSQPLFWSLEQPSGCRSFYVAPRKLLNVSNSTTSTVP